MQVRCPRGGASIVVRTSREIHCDNLPQLTHDDTVDVGVECNQQDGGSDNRSEIEKHQVVVVHHFNEQTDGLRAVLRCMPAQQGQEADQDPCCPASGDYNCGVEREGERIDVGIRK